LSDLCICGSGKERSQCHVEGSTSSHPLTLRYAIDERIPETFLLLAEHQLALLEQVIVRVKIDREDRDRRMAQVCLVFYASKLYRVMKAALVLLRFNQTIEANVIRRQHMDFWIALQYYRKHPDQAVLFMASQPLVQRDSAEEIARFDPGEAAKPNRRAQYAELLRQCTHAYENFPGLRRPKGKSANSGKPIMLDWSAQSSKAMLDDLVRDWIREEVKKNGEVIGDEEFEVKWKRASASIYFFSIDYASQEMHGTAIALNPTLEYMNSFQFQPIATTFEHPNAVLNSYVGMTFGAIALLAESNGVDVSERLGDLQKAFAAHRVMLDLDE